MVMNHIFGLRYCLLYNSKNTKKRLQIRRLGFCFPILYPILLTHPKLQHAWGEEVFPPLSLPELRNYVYTFVYKTLLFHRARSASTFVSRKRMSSSTPAVLSFRLMSSSIYYVVFAISVTSSLHLHKRSKEH